MNMKFSGRSRSIGFSVTLIILAAFLAMPVKAAGVRGPIVKPPKPPVELFDLAPLSGDVNSSAAAINDAGEIVGTSSGSNNVQLGGGGGGGRGGGGSGAQHAFVYRRGRMSKLCNEPSTATAINDAGQIVGSIYSYSTNIVVLKSPLFPPTPLSLPISPLQSPQPDALGTGRSVSSQVVAGGISPTNRELVTNVIVNEEAVLFGPGMTTTLLESTNPSYATGINNQNEIVGGITIVNEFAAYAFAYQSGVTTFLPCPTNPLAMMTACGINNQGDIVGTKTITPGYGSGYYSTSQSPFLWHQGQMQDLGTLGGNIATATAVNDDGEVVGWSMTVSNKETHAFLYQQGQMMDLGGLDVAYSNLSSSNIPPNSVLPVSEAGAINNWGMIVGEALTATGMHAFIYANGTMTDLNNLVRLTRVGRGRGFVSLTSASGINDVGQIVGSGKYWDGRQETTRAFLLDLHL